MSDFKLGDCVSFNKSRNPLRWGGTVQPPENVGLWIAGVKKKEDGTALWYSVKTLNGTFFRVWADQVRPS